MSETLAWVLSIALAASVEGASPAGAPNHSADAPDRIAHLSAAPYPETVTRESEYAQWLENRTRLLLDAAGGDAPLQKRIELRLAAVNWMLATQSEPPMSRLLQQISVPSDGPFMASLMQRALTETAIARTDLKRLDESPDRDDELIAQFTDAIDTLECFGQALRICAAQGAGPDEARRIAADLSFYLEDDRPEVAAAALVWQAALYKKSDRLDRAMRSLPLALTPTHAETIGYDFFARMLRCRYLADRGAFATAWSLMLLLEERSRDWFTTQSRRNEATNSAVLAKLTLCDAWIEASQGPARERTQDWCRANGTRLREEYFSSRTDGALLRLTTAAPIIVDIPDPATALEESVAPPGDDSAVDPDAPNKLDPLRGDGAGKNADEKPESHEVGPR